MAWLLCQHTIRKTEQQAVLRKPLTTIGRASGNDVVLEDPMLSATHCTLMRKGSAYTVSASDRTAEIYVNGRRVRSAELSEGDTVLLGAWQLTFGEGEPQEASEDMGELPLDVLEGLVKLSQEVLKDTEPSRVFTAMLEMLLQITGAEKGFLIIMRDGQRNLAASHNVDNQKMDISRVSDSIVNQVVEHLQPVIVSDAMRDPRFGKAQSVVDLKLSSVMCVPLIYRKDLLGVIYLGNDKVTNLFTTRDLNLLKIYANQAALLTYHALMLNSLQVDNRNLRRRLEQASQGQMIGTCAPMKRMFQIIRRAAPSDLSVLVLGETGTGKELVAREIHNLSGRKGKPFIAINCGAIPENLLESELFGHKKGAFTGAVQDKLGKVEAAGGGTLFLDEIAEMPMNLQVKLLRVLQERVIERVGELTPRPVDIRIVAATNKNPQDLIAAGDFREDLFYRLNEITLELPPLRERGDDIEVLAQYFLNRFRDQYQTKTKGFTNQALVAMKNHYWPGNVRELENRVKKAVIMSDRALLNPDDLGVTEVANVKREIQPLNDAQEEWKIAYIRQALDVNNWNKAQTARDLGVDARTIFRYIEKIQADS